MKHWLRLLFNCIWLMLLVAGCSRNVTNSVSIGELHRGRLLLVVSPSVSSSFVTEYSNTLTRLGAESSPPFSVSCAYLADNDSQQWLEIASQVGGNDFKDLLGVVTLGYEAASFATRHPLPIRGLPLILADCSEMEAKQAARMSMTIAIRDNVDYRRIIQLGWLLYPQASNAVIITSGRDSVQEIETVIKKDRLHGTVYAFDRYNPQELLNEIRDKNRNYFVVVSKKAAMGGHRHSVYATFRKELARACQRPLLSTEFSSAAEPSVVLCCGVLPGALAEQTVTVLDNLRTGKEPVITLFKTTSSVLADYLAFKEAGLVAELPTDTIWLHDSGKISIFSVRLLITFILFGISAFLMVWLLPDYFRKRFLSVYDAVPLGVAIVDSRHRLLYANAASQLRLPYGQVVEFDTVPELSASNFVTTLDSVLNDSISRSECFVTASGSHIMVDFVSISPLVFSRRAVAWSLRNYKDTVNTMESVTKLESDLQECKARYDSFLDLLCSLVKVSPNASVIKEIGSDYIILCANDKFCNLFGYPLSLIQGKVSTDIMPVQWQNIVERSEALAIKNGISRLEATLPLSSNAIERRFLLVSNYVNTISGRNFLICEYRDIQEEEQQRDEREYILALQRFLLSELPHVFFTKDLDNQWRFLLSSDYLADILGVRPSQVVGKSSHELSKHNLHLVDRIPAEGFPKEEFVAADSIWANTNKDDKCQYILISERLCKPTLSTSRLVVGNSIDVTDLYIVLKEQQFTNELTIATVKYSQIGEFMEAVFRSSLEYLGNDYGFCLELDNTRSFRLLASSSSNGDDEELANYQSLLDPLFERFFQEPIVTIDHVDGLKPLKHTYFGDLFKSCAFVSFGIPDSNKKMVICLGYCQKSHAFVELDHCLLNRLGDIVGNWYQNQIESEPVMRQHMFINTLRECIDLPVWLYDRKGALLFRNEQLSDYYINVLGECQKYLIELQGSALRGEKKVITIEKDAFIFELSSKRTVEGNVLIWCDDITETTVLQRTHGLLLDLFVTIVNMLPASIAVFDAKNNYALKFANELYKKHFSDLSEEQLCEHRALCKEVFNSGASRRLDDPPLILDGFSLQQHWLIPLSESGVSLVLDSFVGIGLSEHQLHSEEVLNSCINYMLGDKDYTAAAILSVKHLMNNIDADHCLVLEFAKEDIKGSGPYVSRISTSFGGHRNRGDDSPLFDVASMPLLRNMLRSNKDRNDGKSRVIFCGDLNVSPSTLALKRVLHKSFAVDTESFAAIGLHFGDSVRYGLFWFWEKPFSLGLLEKELLNSFTNLMTLFLAIRLRYEQLEQAAQEAKEASDAEKKFLSSISHEIRTPLNPIIGFSELLSSSSDLPPEQWRLYLTTIADSGQALLAVINDVLDFSKIEAGQMNFAVLPVDLASLIIECAESFRTRIEGKGLQYHVDVAQIPTVLTNMVRFRQVMVNLLSNAYKFTRQGQISVLASFKPVRQGIIDVVVEISDTGRGIAEEDQKKLFIPFVQLQSTRGTYAANNGTGLGLVLCRRILDNLGGTIKVVSKVGEGSSFTVTLNRVAVADERFGQSAMNSLHNG